MQCCVLLSCFLRFELLQKTQQLNPDSAPPIQRHCGCALHRITGECDIYPALSVFGLIEYNVSLRCSVGHGLYISVQLNNKCRKNLFIYKQALSGTQIFCQIIIIIYGIVDYKDNC